MIFKNVKLGYKEASGSTYTDVEDLSTLPDISVDYEKVDTTVMTSSCKTYEMGLADYGDLEFEFLFDEIVFNTLKEFEQDGTVLSWQLTVTNTLKYTFEAQCAVSLKGGKRGEEMMYTLKIFLQTDLTKTS